MNIHITAGKGVNLFLLGIALSLSAVGARSIKTVLVDQLMNNYGGDVGEQKKLTPSGTCYFQAPLLLCIGLVASLIVEGVAPWKAFPAAIAAPKTMYLFFLSCASAASVSITGTYAIKLMGAP